MRFKNVLFINPSYTSTDFTTPVVPVGIGYLAESLKNGGVEYSVLDMTLGYKLNDLRKRILEIKPDLVGISMMSIMYKSHYRIAEFIKSVSPGMPVVAGGPHISSLGEAVLEECGAIDYAVLREGERPLLYLCQGRELSNIPGLLYRKNGEIFCSGEAGEVDNLDELPFPRYENFELKKYSFGISIVSSRGCPFRCVYCSAHVTRKNFRARSAENVADQMEYWYRKGYREFGLQEDNPTFDKARMLELCGSIEKKGLVDLVIMCGNGVRADKIDKELLKRMKSVGFRRLAFGVEGGNDRVLKGIKKGQRISVVKNAIKDACDLGFFVSLFFIVGSPAETARDVEDSINIARAFSVSHVNFFNLIPLPGTELYKWIQDNDYFIVKPEEYLNKGSSIQMRPWPVFETPEFPAKDRVRMLKKGKSVERMVKRSVTEKKLKSIYPLNKLIAWFYTLSWVERFENNLMRYPVYRNSIGRIKAKIRLFIYKDKKDQSG